MIKYGCVALAIACCLAAPAAQAKGNFFVAGQIGQATYDDSDFDDNSASTRALSGGYRWQAGDIVQVGIEAGLGKVDEITQDYYYSEPWGYVVSGRAGMEADYRHVGVNARINFGTDSRWFGIARSGYMSYEMDSSGHYEARINGNLVTMADQSASDDGSGAYFGVGVGVDLTQNVNLNVMYNGYAYSDFESDYSEDDIGTASTTTLGVEVRF